MVRIFIVFHDCGHGSFFKSRRTCDAVGVVLGVLTFTPYFKWTREHAVHHATVGDLDRRGEGDVWTMTVEEYRKSPRWKRAIYRVYRSPFFLFGVGSFLLFVAMNRFDTRLKSRQDMVSVYGTDLALAGLATGLSMLMGVRQYFMVQVPILFFAAAAGVWLFYVQHQFDGVVWSRHGEWDYRTVALRGSSFYRLPKVLQWFSGNIGYHHAHHLSPRIPNYKLPACSTEDALSREAKVVSLKSSMRSLFLRLWDEKSGRMVGFRKLAGGTGR
jgi:omega-6 fatty acid desaturase (delta-12 desaturase)